MHYYMLETSYILFKTEKCPQYSSYDATSSTDIRSLPQVEYHCVIVKYEHLLFILCVNILESG